MSTDHWIFHILLKRHWEEAQKMGYYTHASLQTQGFIHSSLQAQVLKSIQIHFKEEKDLYILAIDPEKLQAELKYEFSTSRQEDFPHIYGRLNLDAVERVYTLEEWKQTFFS